MLALPHVDPRKLTALLAFVLASLGCSSVPSSSVDASLRQLEARGEEAYQRGNYDIAEMYWHRGLQAARRQDAELAIGRFLTGLARVDESAGRYARSVDRAEEAAEIARRFGDRALEARSLNALALGYRRLADHAKSLSAAERALALARRIADKRLQAESLRNIGGAQQMRGNYDEALSQYEASVTAARSVADASEEAKGLNNMGGAYRARGDYRRALTYYESSLAVRTKVHDQAGEGRVLGNICLVYENLGDYTRALNYCRRSLDIAHKRGDRQSQANNLNNIGAIYRARGDYREALSYYRRSVALKRKYGDRAGVGRGLNNIGEIFAQLRKPKDAVAAYQQSVDIKRAIGDRSGESATEANLGDLYVDQHRYKAALVHFQRALALQATLNQPEVLWRLFDGLSRTEAGLHHRDVAILFGKLAVNSIQSVRANISELDEDLQRWFLQDKMGVYRQVAGLLVDAGRLPEAEQVLAMLKEEEYFDFIRRDAGADVRTTRAGYSAPEQPWNDRYQQIAADLVSLGEERSALIAKDKRSPGEQARLREVDRDLDVASDAFSDWLDDMTAAFRQLEGNRRVVLARRQLDTARMGTVSDLGPGTVLVQYIVLKDWLRILLTTADVQKPYKLATKAEQINRLTCQLLETLRSPRLDPRPPARALYDLLIAPLAADLDQAFDQVPENENGKTLMVSLDGVLRYVPFAALYDGRQYLAERYALAVYIAAAAEKIKDKPERAWKVAGFGVTKEHSDFPALTGVRAELEGIIKGEGHPGGVLDGTIRLDQDFTRDQLRDALSSRYPVVHVASHFRIAPTDADSVLLLGDGSTLSLDQIRKYYHFKNVDLLTLSACDTAVGSGQGGEVESLAVTAEKSGAKGVLATLWSVEDATTAVLMRRMYAMREDERVSKAQALRLAQLELLDGELRVPESPKAVGSHRGQVLRVGQCGVAGAQPSPYRPDPSKPYAHPYYWAPFILMGNWL